MRNACGFKKVKGKKIDRGWNPEDAGEQERCGASQLDARPQRK
jgi:hypothetical protein